MFLHQTPCEDQKFFFFNVGCKASFSNGGKDVSAFLEIYRVVGFVDLLDVGPRGGNCIAVLPKRKAIVADLDLYLHWAVDQFSLLIEFP